MSERTNETHHRTFTEEIEIAGSELIQKVKSLLSEGNVRRLRIKAPGGEVYFETPLTVGVLAGGAVAVAAPWLAILGALAALVTRVKIEVEREVAAPAEATTTKAARSAKASKTAKPARTTAKAAKTAKPAASTKRSPATKATARTRAKPRHAAEMRP